MAFRASRKQSSQKSSDEKPEAQASTSSQPSQSLNIEDVVGAPIEKNMDKPASEKREPEKELYVPRSPDLVDRPPARPTGYGNNYRRGSGRMEYGRNSNSGSSSGSYRPQRFNGPARGDRWGRDSFSDNNSSRSTSVRRDTYEQSGPYRSTESSSPRFGSEASFTQDIDVPTETVQGILDTMPEGHGFLRPKFTPSERDIYISQSQIRRFLLRNGDMVEGQARPPKDNERYWGLLKVEKINGYLAEEMAKRPKFEDLVPVYPNKQLRLETGALPLSTRIIDRVAPIGFGQRGLIVSPPKAGKTTILKELAAGISANYPEVHLMAALIGERPEEVTDITRSVKGEVLASNFDESPAEQTRIAEVALDRAKRLVEMGKDVVILLDSITRLARAYNLVVNPSGRTLSGGFDPAALYPAKRFLGAARCVEPFVSQSNPEDKRSTSPDQTGGSLTVIGTALVDTGSRMDDLIYEEFKGTGNMELHLSRAMQERRVFPAIDLARSGTRHDELLLGEDAMKKVTTLRHMLSLLSEEERTVMVIERLSKTKTNAEFLESLAKG